MKKNVAGQIVVAQLINAADGTDATTGTCNVAVEIDGVAGTGGTATHIANGKWEYAPIQADTNGDHLTFQFVLSGAITTTVQAYTSFPQTVDNDVLAQTIDGKIDTAQADLDTITDTDGVILGAAGVDLIWDEPMVGHGTADTSGLVMNEWQDAGRLDAILDTIAADVVLIKGDTGTDGVVISAATANAIADALLDRDMSVGTDANTRSPRNALRFLRNKYSISGTTLTVTQEDDTTSAWTSVLTTDAAADPVTGSDPVG